MSDLDALIGGTDSETIPGHVLSRPRLNEISIAEVEFEKLHLQEAVDAGARQEKKAAESILELASRDVRNGFFSWGMNGFDARCLRARSLPFLLWLTLLPKEPNITRAEAAVLLSEENWRSVSRSVLKLFGFKFDNDAKKENSQTAGAEPTGAASSDSSAKNVA